MIAHRMLIKSLKPPSSDLVETSELELETSILLPENITAPPLLVVMGDPSLPSSEKLNQTWNPEDIETIEILRQAVVSSFGADREVRFLDSHQRLYFDLVSASMMDVKPLIFNLCDEGYLNHARLEMHVPALLDLLQLPYTGAAPACLAICYDKGLVNALAGQLGVPVPAELYIPAYLDVDALSQAELESLFAKMVFPAFVKPVRGDGSVGITAASVVKSIAAAVAYIKVVRQDINVLTKDVIVQEYLCGDEVSVGIIGNPRLGAHGKVDLTSACFMPVLKADFSALPKDLPPILAYDSKWNPESPYWTDVCYKPATITEEQQNALYQHCAVLCERFELRDFGRFDWRWSNASGCFKLLEVNPNPGWCHDGKAAIMAKMMGLSYPEMIAKIVTSAEERMMRSASK
jgi:D-alanine-D-alanine ligase